ncbi:MAG: LytTR family DNA-binding domain-containing protein [Terriglobia bacterium]
MEANPLARIKTVIVDDEILGRERIRAFLKKDSQVDIVGECANGREAVAVVRNKAPDLLFLDIQMPEMDGFGVLKSLVAEPMPVVIFVTAYDQYALRAFEVHALGYLLKPFDADRFRKTLEHAKEQIAHRRGSSLNQGILDLLKEMKKPKPADRLVVKRAGRISFLKISEIDWIEAEGNYVKLHSGKESFLVRETLNQMEERLDSENFLRIHRSTIVNINCVKELRSWFHGDYQVVLHDKTELLLSRKYRERLRDFIGKSI